MERQQRSACAVNESNGSDYKHIEVKGVLGREKNESTAACPKTCHYDQEYPSDSPVVLLCSVDAIVCLCHKHCSEDCAGHYEQCAFLDEHDKRDCDEKYREKGVFYMLVEIPVVLDEPSYRDKYEERRNQH